MTTIDHDLPCLSCSYNLRTLAQDGRCPECNTPVATTLAAYCDFEYLAAGLNQSAIPVPSATPILYAKDPTPRGEWLMVFVDGHVEKVPATTVPRFMTELNKARLKAKLPPLPATLPIPPGSAAAASPPEAPLRLGTE